MKSPPYSWFSEPTGCAPFRCTSRGRGTRVWDQRACYGSSSRNFLRKKLNLFTAKVVTDALSDLARRQEPSGFDYRPLAVDPLWLNPVQPRTFGRQPTRDDAHARLPRLSLLQHCLIVLAQPDSHLLTHPAWEALSQISTSTLLPCAWTCSHSHSRKSVVTWLTGRPDTKRRCMRPLVAESIP
jgi:hypothetical protein